MKINNRKRKIYIFLFGIFLAIGIFVCILWKTGIFLEIKESFPDDYIIEEDDENFEWWDVDYSTIMKKGEASTGLTHFLVNGSEFVKKIEEYMKKSFPKMEPAVETMDNSIGVDKQTGENFTYYENYTYWYPDSSNNSYKNYFRICRDTVSDQLVDVLVYHQDKKICEQFVFYAIECIYGKISEENQKKIQQIFDNYTIESGGYGKILDISIDITYDGERYEYFVYKEEE